LVPATRAVSVPVRAKTRTVVVTAIFQREEYQRSPISASAFHLLGIED
jgi:hypothetical protein